MGTLHLVFLRGFHVWACRFARVIKHQSILDNSSSFRLLVLASLSFVAEEKLQIRCVLAFLHGVMSCSHGGKQDEDTWLHQIQNLISLNGSRLLIISEREREREDCMMCHLQHADRS